ncbi:LysR family transcriptional regulator [Bradyrhizobium liaoningense]|uniref:LysR family transcriptional regulator n=1 Tax=Bradyrhizobium liaoningense TaxID=43992 RepID=UPI0032AF9D14
MRLVRQDVRPHQSGPKAALSRIGRAKLSLRQLTYFLATANHESVLRASETLNVSSASISTAIAQIEEFLQTQLFIRRHARGLVLTSAGQDLAAHARNILLHAREIEAVAQRGPFRAVGRINVGCLATIAPYLIPLVLRDLQEKQSYAGNWVMTE